MWRKSGHRCPVIVGLFLCILSAGIAGLLRAQTPLGTAFTYQGRLMDGGAAANGPYDLQFALYDAAADGNTIGSILTQTNVNVGGGVFTVLLDFGSAAFAGQARWLQIGVRPGGAAGSFVTVNPRQMISPVPNALYASSAANAALLAGQLPVFYLDFATHSGVLEITKGGTGAVSAVGARGTLGAAASGANADITSLSGLTTPLSVSQGGTGGNSIATSSFQARVNGSCTPGASIRSINSDGTVVCGADVPRAGVVLATLESSQTAGDFNSLTIGSDGLGLISYYADTDLKVAHCQDVACTTATLTTLDSANDVGAHSSITIGQDGLGLISYVDRTNGTLKVAHCSDVPCTGATLTTVDAGPGVNTTAITLASDKFGAIVYDTNISSIPGGTQDRVQIAHCKNVLCTLVEKGSTNVGLNTQKPAAAIVTGANALGIFAFARPNGPPSDFIETMHCLNLRCADNAIGYETTIGDAPSITIGLDGFPLLAYFQDQTNNLGSIAVAHCVDVICSGGAAVTPEAVVSGLPWKRRTTSIAIGSDGLPVLSYTNYLDATTGALRLAHCTNATCSSSTISTVETGSALAAWSTSMAIGADGFPLISYHADLPNFGLKVAHCANVFCSPFVARAR